MHDIVYCNLTFEHDKSLFASEMNECQFLHRIDVFGKVATVLMTELQYYAQIEY